VQDTMKRKTGLQFDLNYNVAYIGCFPFGDTSRHKYHCLCYLLSAKENRTMFVSTCVTKWKAPIVVDRASRELKMMHNVFF